MGCRAPLSRNSALLKKYLDFGIIVRDFAMRFELLNVYLWFGGKGKLAAACQVAQWERGPQSSHTVRCSLCQGCCHKKHCGLKCLAR